MDPFETLGIPPSFSLDAQLLAERQRELSKMLHPDKHIGRSAGERRAALGRAIEVNEAHRALTNPLSRAEALLKVLQLDVIEGQEPKADPDLLMSMMELREDLREAGRRKDVARVEELAARVRITEGETSASLGAAFERALELREGAQPNSLAAQKIHEHLGALRYYRRFLEEADAILDELV